VEIHSGIGKEPHAATSRDVGIRGNGRLNIVPLRVGCLEHLGAGKVITEERLPAYDKCIRRIKASITSVRSMPPREIVVA
jgi:hypothetical protein